MESRNNPELIRERYEAIFRHLVTYGFSPFRYPCAAKGLSATTFIARIQNAIGMIRNGQGVYKLPPDIDKVKLLVEWDKLCLRPHPETDPKAPEVAFVDRRAAKATALGAVSYREPSDREELLHIMALLQTGWLTSPLRLNGVLSPDLISSVAGEYLIEFLPQADHTILQSVLF